MGIDYYVCDNKNCGEGFPDVGEYVMCECGCNWCSDECAEEDGFQEEENGFTPDGSKWEQETSCKYCRKEDFNDGELLRFALGKLSLSRNQLIKLYKSK